MRSPLIDPSSNPNGAHLDGLLEVIAPHPTPLILPLVGLFHE